MTENQFNEITEWQDKTFPGSNANSKLVHLRQELEELVDALHYSNTSDCIMEYADCFILLFGSAKSFGLTYSNITQAIDVKMEINKKRIWGTPDANGVVNHIK